MSPEIRATAGRFYLLFDALEQLMRDPNRQGLCDQINNELNTIKGTLETAGLSIEQTPPPPPGHLFPNPRPIVVLNSGLPVAPEHNRLDLDKFLAALIG